MRYVHADDVLPADLVQKVRQHHVGLVYFSADHAFYERRKLLIAALAAEGCSTQDIAQRVHLSRRRVQQILKEQRSRQG